MCESSKARRPDTEWVPGALLPVLTGRATESAALHPYPIGRTCPAMDFFHPTRPSPCESFRAANWQMRRRVPSAGGPTAVLPQGAFLLRGVSTRGKSPRKGACEVIVAMPRPLTPNRERPLPLSKSLPRAAYRTVVRSFSLYHILNK